MGDLEEIDRWQPALGEDRIDVVLDVARQQDSASVDLAEQDDRYVVDRPTAVGRLCRHATRIGPQDVEPEIVDGEPVAGRELTPVWSAGRGERRIPLAVARS